MGPVVYILMHAIVTGLMVVKIKDSAQYFMKRTDVLSGIGSGVLIFLCAWMIVYNIVYTLWEKRKIDNLMICFVLYFSFVLFLILISHFK